MELRIAQRMVQNFYSEEKFQKIIEESKLWKFTCRCGKKSSIWDAGGVRYKASGKPHIRLKCPHCNQVSMMKIYKITGQ